MIVKIETVIINNLHSKKAIFTPIGFFIYYYITKIAQTYPITYYSLLHKLESIALSITIILFMDYAPIYDNIDKLTYADLCYRIIDVSLDFILNGAFESSIYSHLIIQQCKANIDKIKNNDIVLQLIKNDDLYSYLTNSVRM